MQGIAEKTGFLNQWMPQNKVSFVADFLLAGMVVGPVIAPYLSGVHVPGIPIVAQIIYFMGHHVCPQPEMGIELSPPFIMAVCMRCYGTVAGLFLTRMLYALTKGRGAYWLHQYGWWGVGIASVLMTAYPIELAIQTAGFWEFDNTVVSMFGLITGLAWGLHAMPILHTDLKKQSVG